jgi:hypothetical protein
MTTTAEEPRPEGFYRVVLGQNPSEIAYWERGASGGSPAMRGRGKRRR